MHKTKHLPLFERAPLRAQWARLPDERRREAIAQYARLIARAVKRGGANEMKKEEHRAKSGQ